MTSLRRDATSGLIVLVPIIVSLYVLAFIYRTIAQLPLIETIEPAVVRVPLTIVVFAALVLAIGYLMRTASGPIVEEAIDGVINRVPGLRVVYNASKMAVETAVTGTGDLQAPVKLETWNGLRMTAFKTGTRTEDGRDILFLPTAPNITTGFVVEVDPDQYEETDERVEDALTRVLSAGFGEADETGMPSVGRTPPPSADDD